MHEKLFLWARGEWNTIYRIGQFANLLEFALFLIRYTHTTYTLTDTSSQ